MAGTVIVPWYATGLRAKRFEPALGEIAAVALRYGATSYAVYKSRDDAYRFQQLAAFPDHIFWERYWEGPEMIDFRARHSGWYQVPVLYGWWDRTAAGAVAAGNGHGNGGSGGGSGGNGHTGANGGGNGRGASVGDIT
ncbi:MAG: hypothetical protein FWD42_05105 [Solirubrobacterales bacterium]|nr:hypothetical protein [Solirubrobacterales bacterium]